MFAADFYSYWITKSDWQDYYLLQKDRNAKIETERFNWIFDNHKKLRSEGCEYLKDTVVRTDGQLSELDKRMVVLPSSYTGGLNSRPQDAMM